MIVLAFTAGEWAAVGAAAGAFTASLAAVLTIWKLVDRMREAVRGVVRDEQRPVRSEVRQVKEQVEHVQAEVTTNGGASLRDAVNDIRDEQREHMDYAYKRDARLDGHAEKIGRLDERVTRVEQRLDDQEGTSG